MKLFTFIGKLSFLLRRFLRSLSESTEIQNVSVRLGRVLVWSDRGLDTDIMPTLSPSSSIIAPLDFFTSSLKQTVI